MSKRSLFLLPVLFLIQIHAHSHRPDRIPTDYEGPAIKSIYEVRYFGHLSRHELLLGDSLAFNIPKLDTISSVLRSYSEKGLLLREDYYEFPAGRSKVRKEHERYWVLFEYDERDSLVKETVVANDTVLYSIIREYDEQSNLVKKYEDMLFGSVYNYEYAKSGKLVSSTQRIFMQNDGKAKYFYDAGGRLIHTSFWSPPFASEDYYFYNEKNQLVRDSIVDLRDYDYKGKGKPKLKHEYTGVNYYTYNEQGDLVKRHDAGETDEYFYSYDQNGNWLIQLNSSYRDISNSWSQYVNLLVRKIEYY